MTAFPSLEDIRATAARIAPYIIETPTLPCYGPQILERLAAGTELYLKMELLQRGGSFKPRGAINVVLNMNEAERAAGVTAISAGNHAIATAYAARTFGISAKVAMPQWANTYRVERCRALGAEIVFAGTMSELFEIGERLQKEEGRSMVHPFEGQRTFEGTATVGLEICDSVERPDAVIVPIGGGGLIAGIASAVKQMAPDCRIIGVEPEGAQGMRRSLQNGEPLSSVELSSIADSLSAPLHLPQSFAIVQKFVDEIVTIPDEAMIAAMKLMFSDLKLAVEPAGASSVAAILGPLKDRLAGQRVVAVLCGSNIDIETWNRITS